MGERVYKKKGRMKESDIFIEVDCFQKNKAGNIVCGDSYMSQKLKEEDRIISVLSDGLGSGIKASVLSAMTATMAMNYTAMNESILQTALSIIHTLPKDMVRKISYSTFCIFDIDCFGNTRIVEYESPAVYLFRRGQAVEIRKKDPDRTGRSGKYLSVDIGVQAGKRRPPDLFFRRSQPIGNG